MIIDEKGKLFGKVNLIDLIIIIVLILAAGILGFKFLSPKVSTTGESIATVTYYAEEITDFVFENNIKVGDSLLDEVKNVNLGEVTEIAIGDAVSYAPNDKGEFVQSSKPNHNSLLITSEVKAKRYEHGMIVNTSRYYVGHSFVLVAGKAKLYLRVHSIEFKE